MRELFEILHTVLGAGQPAMLVTVVASSGSTPAGLGASMLMDKTGRRIGTIGGGAMEYQAEQLAAKALAKGHSTTKDYTLRHGTAGDIGMVCGGDVTVYFCHIAPSKASVAFAGRAIAAFGREENAWLLLQLAENTCHMGLYAKSTGLDVLDEDGGSPLATLAGQDLQALLSTRAMQEDFGGISFYSEPLVRAGRAVVFGGGHVAQALVPVLTSIGFRTAVYDDRPEFASRALFPTADEIIVGDFSDVEANIRLTRHDWLVIVTRGHMADYEVQKQLLHNSFAYVGVIGSRAKVKSVNTRLLAAGIPQAAIDGVHTPIGLSIGAVTPAEIAVSIAGEMIELRALLNKNGC